MSCEEVFDKHPYVYSCCEHSIDGISLQFLKDIYDDKALDPEGYHLICLVCNKIYHLYKLGMKWTELIATHEEAQEFRENKLKFMLRKPEKQAPKGETFSIADIPLFICRICHKGLFETEPFELKEKFIAGLNMSVGIIMKITGTVSKEHYIEEYNKSDISTNTCRPCTKIAEFRQEKAKYN